MESDGSFSKAQVRWIGRLDDRKIYIRKYNSLNENMDGASYVHE